MERVTTSNQALTPQREENALTDLFADLSPDELSEAKEAVLEMTRSRGWTVFRDALDRHVAALNRGLIDRLHPAETVAEYEAKLGEIRGLESIEPVIDGLILLGEEAQSND